MKAILYSLLAIVAVSIADQPSEKKGDRSNLTCYVCNSAHQPHCESPLNRTLASKHLMNCNSAVAKGNRTSYGDPVGCRIIDMTFMDKRRIVRECAYSGENVELAKHTGNKGVISYVTQCDESECNTAKPVSIVSASTILLPIVVATFLRY